MSDTEESSDDWDAYSSHDSDTSDSDDTDLESYDLRRLSQINKKMPNNSNQLLGYDDFFQKSQYIGVKERRCARKKDTALTEQGKDNDSVDENDPDQYDLRRLKIMSLNISDQRETSCNSDSENVNAKKHEYNGIYSATAICTYSREAKKTSVDNKKSFSSRRDRISNSYKTGYLEGVSGLKGSDLSFHKTRVRVRQSKEIRKSKNSTQPWGSSQAEEARKYQSRSRFPNYDSDSISGSEDGSVYKTNSTCRTVNTKTQYKTAWHNDQEGNVRIPEICFYSVSGTCRNEYKGCSRLHANQHYHWQISKGEDVWINLPLSLVRALENAYCNPALENVTLPRLDEKNDSVVILQLLTQSSQKQWTANFEALIVINSDHSKFFSLRRICTEIIQGQVIRSNSFLWYFRDVNSKWVEYGKVYTSGKVNMHSSINSCSIEQHFLSTPDVPLSFTVGSSIYVLDFKAMRQINKNTTVSREVRRRPVSDKPLPNLHNAHPINTNIPGFVQHSLSTPPNMVPNLYAAPPFIPYIHPTISTPLNTHSDDLTHKGFQTLWGQMQPKETVYRMPNLYAGPPFIPYIHHEIHPTLSTPQNAHTDDLTHNGLPTSWEQMQPKERVRRVTLPSHSSEYTNVVRLLKGGITFTNIKTIERIQNPCLWRAFKNKVDDMTIAYGNISKVNIKRLFHGTRHDVVDNIIKENFDWRLHGTIAGQSHGRGTYFSSEASMSNGYCKADAQGSKYLFVARVAVGTITKGNSSTVRPPINAATNAPYDSTGSGSIIVKYDKQEYYPEYLVIFR